MIAPMNLQSFAYAKVAGGEGRSKVFALDLFWPISCFITVILLLLAGRAPAQTVYGPTTSPSTQPIDLSPIMAAVAQVTASANQQIQDLSTALAQSRQQVAQLQAATVTVEIPGTKHFGVNLENVTYYSRLPIFTDVMLEAQNFYGGVDSSGNPTADTDLILFSGATTNYAGNYSFNCNGNPTLSMAASPGTIVNQQFNSATNITTATISVTSQQFQQFSAAGFGDPKLAIHIGNVVPGNVKNIQIWRPGYGPGSPRFTNEVAAALLPFDTVRGMNFLNITGSTQKNWTDRPLPTDRNFTTNGGCYEDFLTLCKQTQKTPWICVPCQATPQYLASLMKLCHQQGNAVIYVEWSNEIWNSSFPQWKQARALALADPTLAYDGTGDPNILLYRWMGKQAVNVAKAATAEWGVPSVSQTPIRVILAGQWGNPEVLKYALDYINTQIAAPNQYVYAISIAPYCSLSGPLWWKIQTGDPTVTEQQILADYAATGVSYSSIANALTAAFVAQAKQYNVHTRAYEFGFDSGQAQQDLAQKFAAAHDPLIKPILTTYVNNWWAAGCEGLNWFTLTASDTSNGQWGLTTDGYDLTAPKYQAAMAAAAATKH